MRRVIVAALGITGALAGEPGHSVRLEPAPAALLNLYVGKTGLLSGKTHHFTFSRFDGNLQMMGDAPETGQVDIRIESASIVCRDNWVSEKDRVKILGVALNDMLGADRYPLIRFKSSSVMRTVPDQYRMAGTLTIRETSQTVDVHVVRNNGGTYTGEARFRLTSFGLKPPSAALGLIGTKDEVLFTFSLPVGKPE